MQTHAHTCTHTLKVIQGYSLFSLLSGKIRDDCLCCYCSWCLWYLKAGKSKYWTECLDNVTSFDTVSWGGVKLKVGWK